MKRFSNMFNLICEIDNITRAHKNARKGRTNLPEVIEVDKDVDGHCERIRQMLTDHTSDSKEHLHALRAEIETYLRDNLNLTLKGNWQVFPTYTRGVDFVGYRSFGDFTLLRTGTKKNLKAAVKRLRKKQERGEALDKSDKCTIASYSGILTHCDSYRLRAATLSKIKV